MKKWFLPSLNHKSIRLGACKLSSPPNWILVYYKEKGMFCWKTVLCHSRRHPFRYFGQKLFLLMCIPSEEFHNLYRADTYGQPCISRTNFAQRSNSISMKSIKIGRFFTVFFQNRGSSKLSKFSKFKIQKSISVHISNKTV